MNITIYLIIGIIAAVFIVYLLFLKTMMQKRTQKQLDEFNNNTPSSPLTEVQKRLLAFGGILSYYRGEKIFGIKPEKNLDQYISGLAQQWEITNEAEAKETLNELLTLRKSNELEPILLQPSKELDEIRKDIASGLGIDKNVVAQVQSAYAWDICRAVSLAKWCHWVGYLTETETWEYMQRASEVAVTKGDNWSDYTISFLLGRSI